MPEFLFSETGESKPGVTSFSPTDFTAQFMLAVGSPNLDKPKSFKT